MFSSFKQQGSQWQQMFAQRQSAGPLQRLLAWLILGLMLLAGAALAHGETVAGIIHIGTPHPAPAPDRPRPDLDKLVIWADQ